MGQVLGLTPVTIMRSCAVAYKDWFDRVECEATAKAYATANIICTINLLWLKANVDALKKQIELV